MVFRLTNTISRKKEVFHPLSPNKITIYCCGVTVYDLCHLGHARSYISWDVLRRYLIWKGYQVKFVQNFTDIDDKIINKADKESCSMDQISEINISEFHKDMDALGILKPDSMPRATRCLDEIKSLIRDLENKGAAYSVDGDVYFSVLKKSDYGKLSGRELYKQKSNADGRIDSLHETRKNHPFDFALWKSAKPGEPSFPSIWGHGRPGWHIECSAMVRKELGETIDIHVGGSDLIFPHHENEIAQSETATGKDLARYWLHNGMVNVDGEKMSKSLGNFTTIRSLLANGTSPMTLRFFVLQAHYRKPLDFTDQALNAASIGWKGLNSALLLGDIYCDLLDWETFSKDQIKSLLRSSEANYLEPIRNRFVEAMDDDLNTSSALSIVFELVRPLKKLFNSLERGQEISWVNQIEKKRSFFCWLCLVDLCEALGFSSEIKNQSTSNSNDINISENQIQIAIEKRRLAKTKRDFESADRIRQELKELGIELIDKPGEITEWFQI